MVEKKRIRPRSLEGYSEEVRGKARQAFIEYCFADKQEGNRASSFRSAVESGMYDDMPMLQMAAFIISGKHASL